MKRRLMLRFNSGFDIGQGHAVRINGLMSQLSVPVELIVVGKVQNLPGILADAELSAWVDDDGDEQRRCIKYCRPDAILVDLPARSLRPWSIFNEAGVPVIAIDDEGGDVDAAVIVNGTAYPEFHHYARQARNIRYFIGPKYALIRPEFAAHPWQGPKSRRVAVIVGSGVRATDWVLKLLHGGFAGLDLESIDFVVGASFSHIDELKVRVKNLEMATRVHQGLSGRMLADLMSKSSVALMTGGMIVYEALAVGVPAVVFPNVENLISEIAWFERGGFIRNLGYKGAMDLNNVHAALNAIFVDQDAARTQSIAGKNLIDGLGMNRVASAIDSVLTI